MRNCDVTLEHPSVTGLSVGGLSDAYSMIVRLPNTDETEDGADCPRGDAARSTDTGNRAAAASGATYHQLQSKATGLSGRISARMGRRLLLDSN